MVLHPEVLEPRAVERVARREVVGVQVVRDHLGRDGEQAPEVLDALAEGPQRLVGPQVADVGPDPGPSALGQAEGALELGAAGQHRAPRRDRQRRARGDVAARAAQEHGPPAHGPQHRVVRPRVDRSVVGEDEVGDGAEPLGHLLVAVHDGLVGDVPARHDEDRADVGQEQVMQRRVGQHHAEVGRARGDRGRHPRARAARGQHDGALGTGEQRRVGRAQLDELPGRPQGGGHQRERLVLAVLAGAQGRHGPLVGGDAGQVIAADPLDRDDRPGEERRGRRGQRVAARARGPRRRAAAAAGRRRRTRSAGRGSGGPRGPRTRPGRRGTCESRPSWSGAGRTAPRGRS